MNSSGNLKLPQQFTRKTFSYLRSWCQQLYNNVWVLQSFVCFWWKAFTQNLRILQKDFNLDHDRSNSYPTPVPQSFNDSFTTFLVNCIQKTWNGMNNGECFIQPCAIKNGGHFKWIWGNKIVLFKSTSKHSNKYYRELAIIN